MKIVFAGDVFLGGDLKGKSCKNIVNSEPFINADYRVLNLEQAISDNKDVANKCTLHTDSSSIKQLIDLKINAVNIANNHIHDKNTVGINDTVRLLSDAGISSFGAGSCLSQARKPHYITDKLAILGYCDYDRPTLNQIQVANSNQAGVAPLRYDVVYEDLAGLPDGVKVFLYFHWGTEHIIGPSVEEKNLAKKLLNHSKVIAIFGMHAHRIQGAIKNSDKLAYMCLGNFIFPNFYISPPTQIFYPSAQEKKDVKFETRLYLEVFKNTYKKWYLKNRVSMYIEYDTEKNKIEHHFVKQGDNDTTITDLKGIQKYFYLVNFHCLSSLYKLPDNIYSVLRFINRISFKIFWRLRIRLFQKIQRL